MTLEDIANRLNRYYLWLSSRQLEKWWPLLIAVAVLFIVLILLRLRSRRKVLPTITQLRDIIDIKLADDKTNGGQIDRTENNRSAHIQNEVEVTDSRQVEPPIQKVYEVVPDHEPFKLEKSEQGQFEKVPEESSEQDLKSKKQARLFEIAEFCKAAISRRQRLRSGIFNEYSELDED